MKDFEVSALPEERVSFGRDILSVPVIVAALGYFVDIYDLILFSIVRFQSLKAIGLSGQELLDKGVYLLNMQMAGMFFGGGLGMALLIMRIGVYESGMYKQIKETAVSKGNFFILFTGNLHRGTGLVTTCSIKGNHTCRRRHQIPQDMSGRDIINIELYDCKP